MRDRRAQRRLAPRALGVDVDPLVVAAHVRELVDSACVTVRHALSPTRSPRMRSRSATLVKIARCIPVSLRTRNPSSRFASTGG